MASVEIQSVYHCDVYTFWENLYFLKDYGQAVYVDGLGFRRWELLAQDDDGKQLRREVLLEKPLDAKIPKAVRKLVGDTLRFVERGVFDRATAEYHLTLTAERFKKNGQVTGRVRADPHPDGCLRTVWLDVNVHMLGLGKLIEGALLEGFASGYRDGVQYGNALLARRGDATVGAAASGRNVDA